MDSTSAQGQQPIRTSAPWPPEQGGWEAHETQPCSGEPTLGNSACIQEFSQEPATRKVSDWRDWTESPVYERPVVTAVLVMVMGTLKRPCRAGQGAGGVECVSLIRA